MGRVDSTLASHGEQLLDVRQWRSAHEQWGHKMFDAIREREEDIHSRITRSEGRVFKELRSIERKVVWILGALFIAGTISATVLGKVIGYLVPGG